MSVKLLILDGKESGVEINLESDKIFSIGTLNDSDFFLTKKSEDFNVFFNALNKDVAEWWSNKKVILQTEDGQSFELSAKKTEIPLNNKLMIAGRTLGLYSDPSLAAEALGSAAQEEAPQPAAPAPEEASAVAPPAVETKPKAPESQQTTSFSALDDDENSKNSTSVTSFTEEETLQANKDKNGAIEDLNMDLTILPPDSASSSTPTRELRLEEDDVFQPKAPTARSPKQKKNSKMYYAIRLLPFVAAALFFGVYATSQYRSSSQSMPMIKKDQRDDHKELSEAKPESSDSSSSGAPYNGDELAYDQSRRNFSNSSYSNNDQSTLQGNNQGNVPSYQDDNGHKMAPFENPQSEKDRFIASGAEYRTSSGDGTSKWETVDESRPSSANQLEVLRENISKNDFDLKETKQILFPDEKMMSMIRDMLETAGADGIDVRFDRGNYDVYGYVMDDAKWSRIYKILTFDLDLSKVKFSVETSVSLINKFEELLKKFNLSNYVVLSLGNNGEIFAKTYYPPALEGLWLTIKNKFEQKYGDYTKVNEYRAHLGWINVVKVSFDQPAYVLLGDGRRIVEGSVIGGDSVLDAILEDSIRVKSSSANIRYYLINKSSRMANADLSSR